MILTSIISAAASATYTGASVEYVIQTPTGTRYVVFVNRDSDVVYSKSTDGATWSTPTVIFTGTATQISVWYDRWSDISAGLIHCAYTESVTDDTKYRSIDTENSDSLSTETTIFAGASTLAGGALSISRARGGNLYCKVVIDAGSEGGFFRSTDVGAVWGSRANNATPETTDQWILLPGWAADNQDMMMFFWDASATTIIKALYDDSGNTWNNSNIATAMTPVAASSNFPHFSGAVDITNSRNLLLAWSAVDTVNADLRCWHITESTNTEVTNVVTNSTDDQGFAAISIDTDNQDWYAFYGGLTDGTETFNSPLNIYYKVSTDDGSTWGSETLAFQTQLATGSASLTTIFCTPRFSTDVTLACMYGLMLCSTMNFTASSGSITVSTVTANISDYKSIMPY